MEGYQTKHPDWIELYVQIPAGMLSLRAPDPRVSDQVTASVKWLQVEATWRMLGLELTGVTVDETTERRRLDDIYNDVDEYAWEIYLGERVIGNIGLNAIAETTAQLGCKAARRTIVIGDVSERGKGIAQAALLLVLRWAFEVGGFELIASRIKPSNAASLRMANRAGSLPFQALTDGDWSWFAYTKPQWQARRFLDGDGKINVWPNKASDKDAALRYLIEKFDFERSYNESEVNEILKSWHTFSDWPLLRRELFERGYFDRNLDGSNYRRLK